MLSYLKKSVTWSPNIFSLVWEFCNFFSWEMTINVIKSKRWRFLWKISLTRPIESGGRSLDHEKVKIKLISSNFYHWKTCSSEIFAMECTWWKYFYHFSSHHVLKTISIRLEAWNILSGVWQWQVVDLNICRKSIKRVRQIFFSTIEIEIFKCVYTQ